MPRFRKKPVEVEALLFTGSNINEIHEFMGERVPRRDLSLFGEPSLYAILTIEGTMYARPGDWIIKGVAGEFYPCKPDIFDKTYEPVLDSDQ